MMHDDTLLLQWRTQDQTSSRGAIFFSLVFCLAFCGCILNQLVVSRFELRSRLSWWIHIINCMRARVCEKLIIQKRGVTRVISQPSRQHVRAGCSLFYTFFFHLFFSLLYSTFLFYFFHIVCWFHFITCLFCFGGFPISNIPHTLNLRRLQHRNDDDKKKRIIKKNDVFY